jgi:copper chaperone CopZ
MFRRNFLQLVTLASVGGLAPLEAMAAAEGKTITYLVTGFSCITCATGLDTMLSRQKGIVSSKSTYPEGKVTVRFDPSQITEQAILTFITDLGFAVAGDRKS